MFVDSHSHIHEADYPLEAKAVLSSASQAGVNSIYVMGDYVTSSVLAIDYAKQNDKKYGVSIQPFVGIHPHEARQVNRSDVDTIQRLIGANRDLVRGVGEIGLDYYYDLDNQPEQRWFLESQLQIASDLNLPISLHIRSGADGNAFNDLFPILDNFAGKIRGVLHSFTDTMISLEGVLSRGLYVGANGIITFNRDDQLNQIYQSIPLDRLVLETDAPFLTPKPYRGQPNQPSYIPLIAQKVAQFKLVDVNQIAHDTTDNVSKVFGHVSMVK